MANFANGAQAQIILQLVVAVVLGGLIGLEREYKGKEAGLQTYSLVSLGSCLFTIVAAALFYSFKDLPGVSFDPSRIVLAVCTGIGFIGAGVIIYRQFHIEGLTTAAGLWLVSAIGVAVGAKMYLVALAGTVLAIVILVVFGELERKAIKRNKPRL